MLKFEKLIRVWEQKCDADEKTKCSCTKEAEKRRITRGGLLQPRQLNVILSSRGPYACAMPMGKSNTMLGSTLFLISCSLSTALP